MLYSLDTTSYQNIVVLTGAGISAPSGLPTYRGQGGLWMQANPEQMSSAEVFTQAPLDAWRFYSDLRQRVLAAKPNAAHRALARMRLAPGARLTLVTQNVDGLHQLAGSSDTVELHGSLLRTRCAASHCSLQPFVDERLYVNEVPRCPTCDSVLRPDIVFFGESLPLDAEMRVKRALRDCDLFIAIGTSGTVAPASNFVRSADYAGAETILVNLEPPEVPNRYFKRTILAAVEDILPALLRV